VRTPTLALAASLLLATTAAAKPPSKMSDDELVATLVEHKSAKQREKAADELGERRTEGAIEALRGRCIPQEEQVVCEHAIWALEKYRSLPAQEALAAIVQDGQLPTWWRQVALRTLKRENQTLLGSIAPELLVGFRNLDAPFAKNLVEALVDGSNAAARDLTILIAKDIGTKRPVRMAALEAAEAFKHPRLYEVYATLLEDDDKRIQVKSIQGLDRAGLPPLVVQPALSRVALNDDKGDVRKQAWKALRNYVSPDLVPAANQAVLEERNMFAWNHAMSIFARIADERSLPALQELFRNENLSEDHHYELIHAAIRIGDPVVVPSLETLRDTTANHDVRQEAQRAIDLLRGPEEERITVLAGLPVVDLVVVDPSATYEEPPALTVTMGSDGRAVFGAWVSTSVETSASGAVEASVQVDGAEVGAEVTVEE